MFTRIKALTLTLLVVNLSHKDEGTEHKCGAKDDPRPRVKRDPFPPFGAIFPILCEVFMPHRSGIRLHVMEDLLEAILEHVKRTKIVDCLESAGKKGEGAGAEKAVLPAH